MSRYPNDDLFEETRMTFGEHLEELRGALFKSVVGIGLGMAVGLVISFTVVQVIQDPLRSALVDYKIDKAIEEAIAADPSLDKSMLERRIRDQGLVPKSNVKLDAKDVLSGLKRAAPELFGEIPAPDEVISADEVRPESIGGLISVLTGTGPIEGEDGAGRPLEALRRHLTDAQKARLTAVAGSTPAGPPPAGAGQGPADPVEGLGSAAAAASDPRRATVAAVLSELAADPALAAEPDLRDAFLEHQGDAGRPALERDLADWRGRTGPASAPIGRRLVGFAAAKYLQAGELALVKVTQWEPVNVEVQALGVTEGFMIYVKTALITGLVVSSPWIFWQIWQFVAAGLYPHEKKYVYVYLPFSMLLFLGGTMLAFFFVFKPVLDFLFSFNKALNIAPDTRISDWLSFFLLLPLGFGIAFQLPLVMLFVQRLGIITTETFIKQWRIAILSIAVISMVLTPAEPISMLLMAVPLVGLYFLGILMCKYMPAGRRAFDAAYEPA